MAANARNADQTRTRPRKSTREAATTDRSGLEILDREECIHLLATATLGRVGITVGALPVVVPMNFRLVDDQVVLRVGVGTKVDAALHDAVVAFEADDVEPLGGGGWSVSLTGLAHAVTDPAELGRLRRAGIARWVESGSDRYIVISTDVMTGRRIPAASGMSDPSGHMTSAGSDAVVERLDTEECLALLATDVVGRLAVIVGARPVIFPVNYILDGDAIVFWTNQGTKFDAGLRAPVSFEIDMVDRASRAGWSVVVSGRLEEVTPYDGHARQRISDLPLETWAPGPKTSCMRLTPEWVTGRRVRRST